MNYGIEKACYKHRYLEKQMQALCNFEPLRSTLLHQPPYKDNFSFQNINEEIINVKVPLELKRRVLMGAEHSL